MPRSQNNLHKLAPGKHHDGMGLYLHVKQNTKGEMTRSWLLKFMLRGKAHDMGLGAVRLPGDKDTRKLTLSQAREQRDEARILLSKGINPIEHRRSQSADAVAKAKQAALDAVTFQQVAEDFLKVKEPELGQNAKHLYQWRQSLSSYVYPIIGNRPIRDIDTDDILEVLEPIWNTKTTTATRTLNRIQRVLAYATVKKLREGANPAVWKGNLSEALPKPSKKKEPHPSLHYSELPAFMTVLRSHAGVAARAIEWVVLCACRVGDVTGQEGQSGALWAHIDMKARTWTIPKTKTGTELEVPLSGRAMAILAEVKALGLSDERVFPRGYYTLNKTLDKLGTYTDRKTGRPISLHGFRSTFKDWCRECTEFPDHLSEIALAHKVGSAVYQAYARSTLLEKRRALMEAWASFATGTQERGSVVALRKGRR